jgi:hypothetical protein
MVNLNEYYTQQAGSGVAFYPGFRYQKGHGFFGRFFKGNLLPLLQSLGHKLLSTGVDVADDVINNDIDPMTAIKTRGKAAAKGAARDMISTARAKLNGGTQLGSGKRKRRKSIKGVASTQVGAGVPKKTRKRKSSKAIIKGLTLGLNKKKKKQPKKKKKKRTKKKKVTKRKKKTPKRTQLKGKRKAKRGRKSKKKLPKFLEF